MPGPCSVLRLALVSILIALPMRAVAAPSAVCDKPELRAEGRSMLISTHDLAMARRISTRMLFLNQTVIAYGPADEAFTPEILRRTFAGSLLVVENEPGLVEVVDSGSCGHTHSHLQ